MAVLVFQSVAKLFPLQDVKKEQKWRKFSGHASENTFSNAHNSTGIWNTKVVITMSYIQFLTSFQTMEVIFLIDEDEISTIYLTT